MAEPSKVIHVRNVGHEISEVYHLNLPCLDCGCSDILCGLLVVYFLRTLMFILYWHSSPEAEVVGHYKY